MKYKRKKPKKDGSGMGVRANRGRGGCSETEETGMGKTAKQIMEEAVEKRTPGIRRALRALARQKRQNKMRFLRGKKVEVGGKEFKRPPFKIPEEWKERKREMRKEINEAIDFLNKDEMDSIFTDEEYHDLFDALEDVVEKCSVPGMSMSGKRKKKRKMMKSIDCKIVKASMDEGLIYGIVLEPEVVDAQDDIVSADEIRKAAHSFMQDGVIGLLHEDKAPSTMLVESYIAPTDFILGEQEVKKGAWIMVTKVEDEDIKKRVEKGEITGYSIGGFAKRTKE